MKLINLLNSNFALNKIKKVYIETIIVPINYELDSSQLRNKPANWKSWDGWWILD